MAGLDKLSQQFMNSLRILFADSLAISVAKLDND